jgi:hypothetical protein
MTSRPKLSARSVVFKTPGYRAWVLPRSGAVLHPELTPGTARTVYKRIFILVTSEDASQPYLAGEWPLCISGGGTRGWYPRGTPALEPAESAAGALRRPGAMMATGAADQLWGRVVPGPHERPSREKQIDVVSNQYGV